MTEPFIKKCFKMLKREDVKDEMKKILMPFIDLIIQELYPFVYLALLFVMISFLLILGIFILLMRNHSKIPE
jgi:uncharacterized RDD family membrane protein YckC